jgi:thymidine kinase
MEKLKIINRLHSLLFKFITSSKNISREKVVHVKTPLAMVACMPIDDFQFFHSRVIGLYQMVSDKKIFKISSNENTLWPLAAMLDFKSAPKTQIW